MNFKDDFLARVANQAQAATSASTDAVETAPAPAITETAPAATEVVEVVKEEVPAVKPQPEVQPVKAEVVAAKAAPQQQQEPVRSHKAPEKGKKVLKDLKDLQNNVSVNFTAWVVNIEYAELGESQVKVTSMTAASLEAGRINIVATPDIEQELYNIMVTQQQSAIVSVRKHNNHYVVVEIVNTLDKANSVEILNFSSEAQIQQWILNKLGSNGIPVTPENIRAAQQNIIVGKSANGTTVVMSKKSVLDTINNTSRINTATVSTDANATATVTATNAIATTTNASTVPAAAATNVATATTGSATNVPATRK